MPGSHRGCGVNSRGHLEEPVDMQMEKAGRAVAGRPLRLGQDRTYDGCREVLQIQLVVQKDILKSETYSRWYQ